jgi:hypothetical protein
LNIITSTPGVMPNHALPPATNTATTAMMSTMIAAESAARLMEASTRSEPVRTTSWFACSKRERS